MLSKIAAAVLLAGSITGSIAATITIQNTDAPGLGFNDPTPASPVGGNRGTTLGAQRLIAVQYAAYLWSNAIRSTPPITVLANWFAGSCSSLGTGAPLAAWRDFPGAPVANRWYPSALANALHGADLYPGQAEITIDFNSQIGTLSCTTGNAFYLGLDGPRSNVTYDLVTTALHEIAHGLGFYTFTDTATGAELSDGSPHPSRFDDFLYDLTASLAWPDMSNGQRAASAINTNGLVWSGGRAVAAVPDTLTAGYGSGYRPLMYAPGSLIVGSSVLHWNFTLEPPQLMWPGLTNAQTHDLLPPDDLTGPMLEDLGWQLISQPLIFPSTTLSKPLTQRGADWVKLASTADVHNPGFPAPTGGIGMPDAGESTQWVLMAGSEAMCVDNVAGSQVVEAERGCLGTATADHSIGVTVWTGPRWFYKPGSPPSRSCVASDQPVLPWIELQTGRVWDCVSGTWTVRH